MLRPVKYLTFGLIVGSMVLIGAGVFLVQSQHIKLYIIDSNTMAPALAAGDLAIGRTVNTSFLHPGDIISYQGTQAIDTKRVISINAKTSAITVASDNWPDSRETIQSPSVLAKNTKTIPYAGYLLGEIRRPEVLVALIYVPVIWIVIRESRRLVRSYLRRPYSM